MGANEFFAFGRGEDVHEAFGAARAQALYQHGHDGYTGTIAEKSDCLVIHDRPQQLQAALRQAAKLVREDDARIAEKSGPAGAIAVAELPDSAGPGWLFFGIASE